MNHCLWVLKYSLYSPVGDCSRNSPNKPGAQSPESIKISFCITVVKLWKWMQPNYLVSYNLSYSPIAWNMGVHFVVAFFFNNKLFPSPCWSRVGMWINRGEGWSGRTLRFLSRAALLAAKENKFAQKADGGWAATLENMWLPSEKRHSLQKLEFCDAGFFPALTANNTAPGLGPGCLIRLYTACCFLFHTSTNFTMIETNFK